MAFYCLMYKSKKKKYYTIYTTIQTFWVGKISFIRKNEINDHFYTVMNAINLLQ